MKNGIDGRNYCVYVHISPSGKMYIGQTGENNPEHRWRKNGSGYTYKYKNGEYKQPAFANAIAKYGFDNFQHEIIASNLTKEEADAFEKLLIEKLDTMNPEHGYNCVGGGSNGYLSDATRKRISEALKGKNHPMYGKHGVNHPTAKKVVQYDLQGNFIKIWDCISDVQRELGIRQSTISCCCKGRPGYKTAGGFVWRYYEDIKNKQYKDIS